MRQQLLMLLIFLFICVSPNVSAEPVLIVSDGILMGTRGIHLFYGTSDIGFWSVDFVDGTCAQAYVACDQPHVYQHTVAQFAWESANVVMHTSILIVGPVGQFDSFPSLTNDSVQRLPKLELFPAPYRWVPKQPFPQSHSNQQVRWHALSAPP